MIKRKFTVKEIKNYLSWISDNHPRYKIEDIIANISEFDIEEANVSGNDLDDEWHPLDDNDDYDDKDWNRDDFGSIDNDFKNK